MTRDEVLTRLEANTGLEAPRVTVHMNAKGERHLIAYAGPRASRKQASIRMNPSEEDVEKAMKDLI